MIVTALLRRSSRRYSRAQLERMLAATERSRDLAVGRHRALSDTVGSWLEQCADAYAEDARFLDRVSDGQSSSNLNAHQRRAIADELRNCARDFDAKIARQP